MEEDYEQMNTSLNDNNNPFQKHKRKNYYEIIKNKKNIVNILLYLLPFFL